MAIDAALAALGAVEFEGVIEANSHGFDVLKHFFSCHVRFLQNSYGTGRQAGAAWVMSFILSL